jgi:hypothetical protein
VRHGPLPPLLAILLVGAVVFVLASRLARDANTMATTATDWAGLWQVRDLPRGFDLLARLTGQCANQGLRG